MKYLDEYRDPESARKLAAAIHSRVTRPWTIMEVCGGQTHAIARYGIQDMLPDGLSLLHGPGCPVCVTPVEMIDRAIAIASREEVVFCTFGDMLRVPGSILDLRTIQAKGGNIRIVYSPMETLEIARQNPEQQVVFFAIGFETTAPANAMAIYQAGQQELKNLSFLVSQVLVPPAMMGILNSSENRVQGFLAAGHVCTIMGMEEYEPIARNFKVPIVVTGFEPLDILQGILMCVEQLEAGRSEVENQYSRSVRPEGNTVARRILEEVFRVIPRTWRGIGDIAESGWGIAEAYAHLDALNRFDVEVSSEEEPTGCISGLVLQGIKKPSECEAFGTRCTPDTPLGATMVSGEGACSAYYRYRRVET